MKGIKRQLKSAKINARAEISANASHGKFAAGMAAEGYAGGYLDALRDVDAALNGIVPNNSRFWPQEDGVSEEALIAYKRNTA